MTEHDTRALQTSLADKLDADLQVIKSNTVTTERPAVGSVAEQMVGLGTSIKAIHRDIDALQAEMVKQLDMLRKRLGGRG